MDAPEKTINLKEYLRNVQELESSIYRQEKAIEKIDSYIGRDALYAKQRYDNSLQNYREKIKALDNIKYCGPTRPDFIPEPKTIE